MCNNMNWQDLPVTQKWCNSRERSAFNNKENNSFGAMEWGERISRHLLDID
jgi:hypothetical protein